mmetsp:Transcript_40932/g.39486  ORF Transcript_40932/g.39486 Transcript_40932/m.39486 type:complete len:102 (-) Transcript_40932:38-343(-)
MLRPTKLEVTMKIEKESGEEALKDTIFYREKGKNYFFDLAVFDDEAKHDPNPLELLEQGRDVFGFSKFLDVQKKKNLWKKCKVLSYDERTKLFQVQFLQES